MGPDGSAYLLRGGTSTPTGTGFGMMQFGGSATLIAVNPSGTTNWKKQIDGSIVSQPVVSGTQIYLTTSEPPVLGSTPTRQPAFVVFSTSGTQVKRVDIAGDMLSAPVVSPDGQTIYVVAVDMPGLNTSGVAGSSTLYAFTPAGVEKFHIAISQL